MVTSPIQIFNQKVNGPPDDQMLGWNMDIVIQ